MYCECVMCRCEYQSEPDFVAFYNVETEQIAFLSPSAARAVVFRIRR